MYVSLAVRKLDVYNSSRLFGKKKNIANILTRDDKQFDLKSSIKY